MTDATTLRSAPSMRVLEAVADAKDTSPAALEPPLYDVVDPTALDRLVRSAATANNPQPVRVSFRYHGYDVTVSSNGAVELA